MGLLRKVAGVLLLVLNAVAGDLTGHLVITKQLSRKTVSPAVYNLRGTAPPFGPPGMEPANEFERIVVMLEAKGVAPAKVEPQTVVIEQRNGRFDPDLVVIPVGSKVEFPNADPIFHNVFSLSGTQPFDLGFYPRGQSRTITFNRSGIVQVYCHIHANMYAAIVVTSSPWHAKPSRDGGFSWSDIPAGRYRVVAWHKVAGVFQTEVTIPEKGAAEVTIRIPIDTDRRP
jgi:plastocyanin